MDSTIDIIKKYDKNVACWVSEKDNGVYDAMNKGINVVKGEYVYILGSDDMMTYNGLYDVMAKISSGETRLIVSDVLVRGRIKPTKPHLN